MEYVATPVADLTPSPMFTELSKKLPTKVAIAVEMWFKGRSTPYVCQVLEQWFPHKCRLNTSY